MANELSETKSLLHAGHFIDAKDTMNTWCVATILSHDAERNTIRVRYDGWSERWDADFQLNSSKIAPFRKNSKLYTGQKKNAIRDWTFTLQELEAMTASLSRLLGPLSTGDAYETTQFLRGSLFTFVDCLLTNIYNFKADKARAFEFLELVIFYVCNWLKAYPRIAPFYHQGIANPDLFLTDDNVALAMAWPELFFTVNRIFAQDFRTSRLLYNESINKEPERRVPYIKSSYNQAAAYYLNLFAIHGGFESILEMLSSGDDRRVPLELLENLPIYRVTKYFNRDFVSAIGRSFVDKVIERISSISGKELKDLDIGEITPILSCLKHFLSDIDKSANTSELIEKTELDLSLKLLKSPYMEKKLKGVNEIRDKIDRLYSRNIRYNNQWLDKKTMVQWLINQQIVESMLETSHPEFIKRLSDVLSFLAKNEAVTKEHIALLWDSARGRHESLVIETYQVLIDIVFSLKKDLQIEIVNKFREVPLSEYDERFIRLLKDCTTKMFDSSYRFSEEGQFCMDTLFEHMQDSSPLEHRELCLECLGPLVKHTAAQEYLWKIAGKAVAHIKNCESVPQNLRLCKSVIESFIEKKRSYTHRAEVFKKFDKKMEGTVKVLIENTQIYMDRARSQASENAYKACLHGKYSHADNLKCRLEFLEFFCGIDIFTISVEDFRVLWVLFTQNAVSPKDTDLFFKWFTRVCQYIFTHVQNSEIYKDFFCNSAMFDHANASMHAYKCLCKLFNVANYLAKKIDVRNEIFKLRIDTPLIGSESLFQIVLENKNEEVEQTARNFLVNLNLRVSKAALNKKEAIWNEFLERCLEGFAQDNPEKKSRLLRLLLHFVNNSSVREEKPSGDWHAIHMKTDNETDYRKFYVYSNQTIGSLRRRVADLYKRPVDSVILAFGTNRYDSYDDDISLSGIKYYFGNISFVQMKKDELTQQKFLGKNSRLQSLLFSLMSQPEEKPASLAWTLLNSLPVSPELSESIYSLSTPMQELLDTKSEYKLVYSLMIVKNLLKDENWVNLFCRARGPAYIKQVYLNTNCTVPALISQYHFVLVSLIEELMDFIEDGLSPQLITKVFQSLLEIGRTCGEEDEEETANVARNATKILFLPGESGNDLLLETVTGLPFIKDLLRSSLLECTNKYFPDSMVILCMELVRQIGGLAGFLLSKVQELLGQALSESNRGSCYWKLLHQLLEETQASSLTDSINTVLVRELSNMSSEKSSKEQNIVLTGCLSALSVSVPRSQQPITQDLVHLVLYTCLFETPSALNTDPPKCKYPDSRKAAFRLLTELCKSPSALEQVLSFLGKLSEDPHWRTPRYADWQYSPIAQEKSETGFVGLKNLGCTCYMNSCLQQVFNIQSFRDGLLRAEDMSGQSPEESVLVHVQKIFLGLQISDKQYVTTKGFCQAFKDWEGNPVNVYEQMDAEEFFNNFMDKLENYMKGGYYSRIIKDHFGGIQVTECIGKEQCVHRSERNEPFLTLQVQVKNKRTIFEGLDTFVEGDLLEGDNAYQCDHCDAKVTALRRVCIKHLPNILVLALRRFEFDFDTMTRLKVNDYCEFPNEIDMEPYTQEGLERKEQMREKDVVIEKKYPDDYYNFKLRGIVVHLGTAEGGHYYSYIKNQADGKWFEFNDTLVTQFDPSEIPDECFGGEEKWSYSTTYGTNLSSSREKSRNAYLLVYERETKYSPHENDEEPLLPLPVLEVHGEIKDFEEVKEDNERYWRCRSSFSPEYLDFVFSLLGKQSPQILKFVISYFLTIMIRSKDVSKIPNVILALRAQLRQDPVISEWLLEVISVPQILKELLMDCPILEKRKMIFSLVRSAISTVDSLTRFLERLLNSLELAKKPNSVFFAQYYELIYRVAQIQPELVGNLSVIDRLLNHFVEEAPTYSIFEVPSKFSDIYLGYDPSSVPSATKVIDRLYISKTGFPYTFIVATIASNTKYLTEYSVDILMNQKVMGRLASECMSKIDAQGVATLYSHLTKNSDADFNCYISYLIQCISEKDSQDQKPYLQQLTWMLKFTENQHRIEFILKRFFDQLKHNKQLVKTTEHCIDYLIKTARKIPAVAEWICKKTKDLKWVENWLKDNQNSDIYYRTQPSAYQHRGLQWGNNQFVSRPNSNRLENFRKIGKATERKVEWDSDTEIPPESLQPGKKVEIWDFTTQKWNPATVYYNIEDLVVVKNELTDAFKWFDTLSDNLAPQRTGIR